MKVAFISVIRYDEDTVENLLVYYYNIGLRDFYLTLHVASQELVDIVSNVQAKLKDAKFTILRNEEEILRHEIQIYELSTIARKDGFNWIVASDGDELFILEHHNTIQEFLEQYEHYSTDTCLSVKNSEYMPTHEIYSPENCFVDFHFRHKQYYKNSTKTIGKFYTDKMRFSDGLHEMLDADNYIDVNEDVVWSAHFPNRNKTQVARKQRVLYNMWLSRSDVSHYNPAIGAYNAKLQSDPNFFENIWYSKIIEHPIDSLKFVCDPLPKEKFIL